MPRRVDILKPTLGLYNDRPSFTIPNGGLADARNVRIDDGRLVRERLGWDSFFDVVLNGPVTGIDTFRMRDGTRLAIFGTPTDLYQWDAVNERVLFLTPFIDGAGTGQVSVIHNSDVVSGPIFSNWVTTHGIKVGDQIRLGANGVRDPDDAAWLGVTEIVSTNSVRIATAWSGGTGFQDYTLRLLFTATPLDVWMPATYYGAAGPDFDRWYATNGKDAIVRWNGNDPCVTKPAALDFTCKWLCVFKGMMIYGNLLDGGEAKADILRVSSIGDPEIVDGSAGSAEMNGTAFSDRLVAGRPLGDYLVTYGELGTTNILQFVGPPLVFVVRTISTRHGAAGVRAFVDRGAFHEALGIDGLYRFDGATIEPVGDQVFQTLLPSLDPNRHAQVIGYIDRENGEAIYVLPLIGDPEIAAQAYPVTAYTEFYRQWRDQRYPVAFLPRDLPATAIGDYERDAALRFSDLVAPFDSLSMAWNDRFLEASFPRKLMGTADGSIYELGLSDAHAGAPFASYARFGRVAATDGSSRGLLSRIEPATAKSDGTLTVRALGVDRADSVAANGVSLSYEMDESGPRWLSPRVLARFVDVEVRTDGANESWRLAALRLSFIPAGER